MLYLSLVIFAIAALGGLTLAILHFRGKNRPWALGLLHGLLAATALVLLLIPILTGGIAATTVLKWAAGLFVVAALGGFYLFSRHLQSKPLPSAAVVIHGGVAVAGFLSLLTFVVGMR